MGRSSRYLNLPKIFNFYLSSKFLKFENNKVTATGTDFSHRFVIIDAILSEENFECKFTLNSFKGWMAVGAAYINTIKKNNFIFSLIKQNINHGCFLLSFDCKKNNFLWNCNNKDQNNLMNNQTHITEKNTLKLVYNPETESLEIFVNSFKFRLKGLKRRKGDTIQPVIILTAEGDEVLVDI